MAIPRDRGPAASWVLPPERVASICIAVGFRGEALVTAIAVAKAESGFDAHVRNYAAAGGKWGPAVGLFQVRVLTEAASATNAMDRRRDLDAMSDPVNNARFAYDLSKGGRAWSAWTAYTNGSYRQHLSEARRVAANPAANADPGGARSVPLVDNDWIDEDRAALPIALEGKAHAGDLGNRVVGGRVELSMAEASQVSLELEDEHADLLRSADLTEGTPLRFLGNRWLVNSVGMRQGPASPHVVLSAQPAGVVRLRGVVPVAVTISPVQFARRMAKAAGLDFAGGPAAPKVSIAPQQVNLGGSDVMAEIDPVTGLAHGKRLENGWEVLRRLAKESTGYVCFEAGGTLYFATQDWLYDQAGVVYVQVGDAELDERTPVRAIRAIGFPTLDRTIKRDGQNRAYRHVTVDLLLPPGPGWQVRPGQRLWLAEPSGIVTGARPMLVQTVAFSPGDRTTPVRVRAASYTAPGDVEAQPDTVPVTGAGTRGSGTSQNGWPASANPGAIGVTTWKVPGSSVSLQLASRAAPVLVHVAEQFHKRVEPLKVGQCGGYNYRTIADTDTISNHGSGTAIDLNWSEHPDGRAGTFTPAQVREIRKILDECKGLVRWGGDYRGTFVDEMHFEIYGADPAAVKSRFPG